MSTPINILNATKATVCAVKNNRLYVINRTGFNDLEEIIDKIVDSKDSCEQLMFNEKYSRYRIHGDINTEVTVYDGGNEYYRRFSKKSHLVVRETPEMYKKLLEWVSKKRNVSWINNILGGRSEQDRIYYQDKEFLLMPDIKWNEELDSLYLLAIARENIPSVRELTDIHLPMLKNIRSKSLEYIKHLGLDRDKVRAVVHYHPSYWHFHVHFVHVDNTDFGGGMLSGRAILLDDIIQNIEMIPTYYQKATMTTVVPNFSDVIGIYNGTKRSPKQRRNHQRRDQINSQSQTHTVISRARAYSE